MTMAVFLRKKQLFYMFLLVLVILLYLYIDPFKSKIKRRHLNQKPILKSQANIPKLMVSFKGRTGNNMFCYATLIGVSRRNNLLPVISADNYLWEFFNLPAQVGNLGDLGDYKYYEEKMVASYDRHTEHLGPYNTYIDGYFQSWKYFENVRKELITKHFVFHDDISQAADQFIRDAVALKKKQGAFIIGVHVRRGDFVRQRSKGFTAAPVSYYYKAMNYFRRKYSNILFIMISNDVYWAEDNLDQVSLDLAVMIKCNHTVITSGTFSWWVAYLSGGDVVYYHLFPEPGTKIANMTVRADYYPPHWVPL
ncbi:galactoside 2-alpha-L-fucosyltransferase Sec1 isoform X2 [Patella vulgata]|uniref:galactoside 2-alpha-L-fucosyltransferase Sec1 isoform X2 n=1 Tax=Patella vulgata TaxID=6465 RepID=UPI0021806556|nr:galactoside 2-alpha-L-fucosyltransferase Sec1 isoform X2 [Patella vulgata]